jgi:hypothetical protein
MKFYTYIKKKHKEQYFLSFVSFFLKVMEFRLFISTLWYENVDDYDFFKLENFLSLRIHLS